ncbi:hypothetical protein PAPYR_13511 [Paratrimastix pyriformis]|uniref:Uncharacterized protein n=1 Tax=Paratrimastix pyriformis TaxID=342808 RepID=A0ABQ8U079_9EUKA|nr:hypothetical protein PAPYR_13511 [Paratrimastix pyriformis]
MERKADVAEVNEALTHKANIVDVNAALEQKADQPKMRALGEALAAVQHDKADAALVAASINFSPRPPLRTNRPCGLSPRMFLFL